MRYTDAAALIRAGVAGGHRVQGGRSGAARAKRSERKQGRRRDVRGRMATCPGALPPLPHGVRPEDSGPVLSLDRPGGPLSASAFVYRCVLRVQRQHLPLQLVRRRRCARRGASATGPNHFTTGQRAVIDRRSRGETSRWPGKFFHATTQRPSARDDDRTCLWAKSLPVSCDVRATCYPVLTGG
ncbi:hypothetical protein JOE11_002707 [Robbsia andropogonis]